jgi:NADH:ubiquinone oxidoreductase subunit 6 (subunit J)
VDSIGVVAAFYALSGLTVGASLAVFLVRNLIHAVFLLVFAFLGMAGLFVTLSADFLAIAQVLIYAGAISILMIFAVMLTPLANRNNANSLYVLPGVALGAAFAGIIGFVAIEVDWGELTGDGLSARAFGDTVREIGSALLGPHILAFEVASVLLLAALIGAIVLVKEDEAA